MLFSELEMLAEADIFVGTFSSNIGRRVVLMREANGLQRDTAMSVDVSTWHAGRRHRRGTDTSVNRGANRDGGHNVT